MRHHPLHTLNFHFGQAEKEHTKQPNLDFLQSVLAQDLLFRRAGKNVTDRAGYFEALPGIQYEHLETQVIEIKLPETQTAAVVTCLVTAKGSNAKGPFEGVFKNIRFWRAAPHSEHGWELYAWYNEDLL
ncbi:MAG: nuclear transport factor 2 family protein [Saprospiraceae bacterium]|nr:nuclear transport factor 2 family protein [Saprospiraceae bacterium]